MKRRDQIQQLAGKGAEDLKKEIAILRERLWTLRSELVAGKVKNVREIRSLRRTIARTLTQLGKQALGTRH